MFGVDLNPVALELAEVSLWLNGIHQDRHVPWFGYQLMCGNSLVSARRKTCPRSSADDAKVVEGPWPPLYRTPSLPVASFN